MNLVIDRIMTKLFMHRKSVRLSIIALALILGLIALNRFQLSASGPQQLYPIGSQTIETHTKFSPKFGSANSMVIMFRAKQGDLFTPRTLEELASLTRRLESVPAVDPYQVVSLASRKIRDISASTYSVDIKPLMWPETPKSIEEVAELRKKVMRNEMAYGNFVSKDMTAALIVIGFMDKSIENGDVSYGQIYAAVNAAIEAVGDPNIEVVMVGEPVLQALAMKYAPNTVKLAALIFALMVLLLWLSMGSWLGTLLPMLASGLSASFALGAVSLANLSFDPLMMVLAFLMASRSISHSVQFCRLFAEERGKYEPVEAAKRTLKHLFRPSILGLASDVGAVAVMLATPIPILQGAALIGVIWLSTLAISVVMLIPLILADVPLLPYKEHFWHAQVTRLLAGLGRLVTSPLGARGIALFTVCVFLPAAWLATGLKIGDAFQGTPLLWPDSPFNKAVAQINERFPGAERLFVVVEGSEPESLKDPRVLQAITQIQADLEQQPEVISTQALTDVIAPLNMMLHEGNPRYRSIPKDRGAIGQLVAMIEQSADPGDLDQFRTQDYKDGAIHIQLRDHKGATLRAVEARIREIIAIQPALPVTFRFGGGFPAVISEVNNIIAGEVIATITFALAVVFSCCWLSYGLSWQAGIFFLPGVLLSNMVTFGYMAMNDIGLTINTLPVITLGIGLGVDFGFYIVDRIRQHYIEHNNYNEAVMDSLLTAGNGVLITSSTMILSVAMWQLSDLRFQAEMGTLIALWMGVSSICALTLIPALALLIKPNFIFGNAIKENPGAIQIQPAACKGCHLKEKLREVEPKSLTQYLLNWFKMRSNIEKICAANSVPERAGKPIRMDDGTEVAVFRFGDSFYAINDTCTHGTASLSAGDYDPKTGIVECPWHGGSFDVRTGLPVALPAKLPLVRYDTVVRHEQIFLRRASKAVWPKLVSRFIWGKS